MLCILLKQLAFTCRYTDMVPTFGRHETTVPYLLSHARLYLHSKYEVRRHDCTMLHESSLLNDLQRLAWYNNQALCIYGDPAYELTVHLYRQAQNNQDMINYNKAMSEVRVTVESLFGNIRNYFKFIDFKKEMKLC